MIYNILVNRSDKNEIFSTKEGSISFNLYILTLSEIRIGGTQGCSPAWGGEAHCARTLELLTEGLNQVLPHSAISWNFSLAECLV